MKRRILSIIIAIALLITILPRLTLPAAANATPEAPAYAGAYDDISGSAVLPMAASRFVDVPGGAFYADAVSWAVENEVTNGIDATHFGPGRGCTRGQVVTFLWRAAGSPRPNSDYCPFKDVSRTAFYYTAMLWAVENGITNGTSTTTFSPDATCTRGQIVTFLWRSANQPVPLSWYSPFYDVEWNAFYADAVLWAVGEGITNGKSEYEFGPGDTCTRGQVVAFLYRSEVAAHRYDEDPPIPPANSRRIGISMPTADLQRWNQDGQNLRRSLQSNGCTVELQYADNDVRTQISQIENMVYNGAKVLVIAPIDGNALGPVLEWARRAGIAVISYDRLIMNTPEVDYYTTFDNWEVGRLQGEFIRDALDLDHAGGRTFNIEFITGDPGDNNIYDFYGGAMDILRKYLNNGTLICRSRQTNIMDAATDGWSIENAQERFENILSAYYSDRPLHAVLASNDSTAQGVANALASSYSNSVYPVITGQDCDIVSVKNMLNDRQAMSVFKDTRDLVKATAALATAIVNEEVVPGITLADYDNGAVAVPTWLVSPKVCTADNIQELLIDSGYYTWEDLDGGYVPAGGLIGVSMPTADLWRWNEDGMNLRTELEIAGYDVELWYAQNDVELQTAQIENMIVNGAQVLIVAAVDGEALRPVLERAKRAGIKVIAYDRLIMNTSAVDYYVTFDNWDVGVKQGEYIRDALGLDRAGGKTFNIEFITGDPGDNNINFFFDGAMSVLRPYLDSGVLVCPSGQTGKYEAATQNWSIDYAQERFDRILSTYYSNRPLHAVLASNDSTAQGVANALESSYSNSVYPVITGQDCDIMSVINMLEDRQAMSVFKDTRDLVAVTVAMADAIMRGGQVPVNDVETYDNGAGVIPTYLCEPKVCTKDNIQELLIDSGYYTWEDLNRR